MSSRFLTLSVTYYPARKLDFVIAGTCLLSDVEEFIRKKGRPQRAFLQLRETNPSEVEKAARKNLLLPNKSEPAELGYCPDCGKPGEKSGHHGCEFLPTK